MFFDYQWEKLFHNRKREKSLTRFATAYGPKVVERDNKGKSSSVKFTIPISNYSDDIYLIGEFNNWGKSKDLEKYRFKENELTVEDFKNNTSYLFQTKNKILRDPYSNFFDEKGNSVFFDHDSPENYEFKNKKINNFDRTTKVLQTDLFGLVAHFKDEKNKTGVEIPENQTYRFIAESGVIKKIKELGFNYIQFLPFTQSIDGGKWSFRYLTPFLFAIDKRWGDINDFKYMIDLFHENGIGIIMDFVISHIPFKNYKLFGLNGKDVGVHNWDEVVTKEIFGEETNWGTLRYNYQSELTQQLLTDAVLYYIKNFMIDGFRIDNVDGILRYGVNGDGDERPKSREFLRSFNKTIYEYSPETLIFYESHYFYGNNSKWLVQPFTESPKALGASAYTSSRLTYFLHTDFMPKSADFISPWKIKQIKEEEEWGKSASTIADFHNHDAAAGLMVNRATGSYAYDALVLKNPELHYHAVGKIKVMEAIISFTEGGRTLDLLQTHLLQTGTFEHNSTISWELENIPANRSVLNFKKAVNEVLENKAFWPSNNKFKEFINVDEKSKTLVIARSTINIKKSGYLIIINMSSQLTQGFTVPAPKKGKYKVVLNSDDFEFAGTGRTNYPENLESTQTKLFEFFSNGLNFEVIAPYGVVVLKY